MDPRADLREATKRNAREAREEREAADEDVLVVSKRLIRQNRTAYQELAK